MCSAVSFACCIATGSVVINFKPFVIQKTTTVKMMITFRKQKTNFNSGIKAVLQYQTLLIQLISVIKNCFGGKNEI